MAGQDFYDRAYEEDFGSDSTLGIEDVVSTTPTGVVAAPPPGGVNQAPIGQGIAALQTAAAPAASQGPSLLDQLLEQWSPLGESIAGESASTRAGQLAGQLEALGIKDLSKLGIGKEARYVGGDSRAKAGELVDWSKYQGAPTQEYKYLTYDGKNLGYLPTSEAGGSAAPGSDLSLLKFMDPTGKGNVQFTPVLASDGSVRFQPKWEASSDAQSNAIIGMMLASVLAPMAGTALGSTASSALGAKILGGVGTGATAGAIQGAVSGGDILESALKGGLTGGIGSAAATTLSRLASEAAQLAGGADTFLGDIAKNAVTGAGKSALGAAIRGDSIADALLSGGLGGATSSVINTGLGAVEDAFVKGAEDLGLPDNVAKIASKALVAEAMGKDGGKAALNALIGEALSGAGQAASKEVKAALNLADADKVTQPSGFPFPADSEDIDNLLNELYIEEASTAEPIERSQDEVDAIEKFITTGEGAGFDSDLVTDAFTGDEYTTSVADIPTARSVIPQTTDQPTQLAPVNITKTVDPRTDTDLVSEIVNGGDNAQQQIAQLATNVAPITQPTTSPLQTVEIIKAIEGQQGQQSTTDLINELLSQENKGYEVTDLISLMDKDLTAPEQVEVVGKKLEDEAVQLDPIEIVANKLPPYEHTDEGNLEKVKQEEKKEETKTTTPTKTTTTTTQTTQKPATKAESDFDLMSLLPLLLAGRGPRSKEELVYAEGPERSVEEIFGMREPTTLEEILRRRA